MKTDQMLFILELSSLLTKHKATIFYTNDDDGIHVESNGEEVFKGFLDGRNAGHNLYRDVIKRGRKG
jgi:hypothetical protein